MLNTKPHVELIYFIVFMDYKLTRQTMLCFKKNIVKKINRCWTILKPAWYAHKILWKLVKLFQRSLVTNILKKNKCVKFIKLLLIYCIFLIQLSFVLYFITVSQLLKYSKPKLFETWPIKYHILNKQHKLWILIGLKYQSAYAQKFIHFWHSRLPRLPLI